MKLKNKKGFTGIDISIALIIVVLFVSLIVTLLYNFGMSSKEVNRKSQAIDYAISKIEEMKKNFNATDGTTTEYRDIAGDLVASGGGEPTGWAYKITTKIQDYANSSFVPTGGSETIQPNIVKILNVNVEYSVGSQKQNVQLSTIITKGDQQ